MPTCFRHLDAILPWVGIETVTCKALRTLGARPDHFRIRFVGAGCFVFLAQDVLNRHDSLGGQREAWAHGRWNLDLDFER